ncbi:hypothetical protein ACVRXQ_01740 [Streptococcus panodentis]|uniref:Uncharacterized protein n=1 Tax=Streptococcus panodentis TaxID=1581472 RepID=A0ABS5AXY1_9STRE|nr:hypothetical protein [Streptococcus panodentis]MBP2621437.1 hypothetical protein [Streptococcus panodentis]
MAYVSAVFKEGMPNLSVGCLRGDPYLWRYLAGHYAHTAVPYPVEDFRQETLEIYRELTGRELRSGAMDFVDAFHHGGMSSGMLCADYWLAALPILAARLQDLNQAEC